MNELVAEPSPVATSEFFEQGGDGYLIDQRDKVGFEGIDNINLDTDLWFKLRGHSLNPLIDASTPLFGMVMRIRSLQEHGDVNTLYDRVKADIAAQVARIDLAHVGVIQEDPALVRRVKTREDLQQC